MSLGFYCFGNEFLDFFCTFSVALFNGFVFVYFIVRFSSYVGGFFIIRCPQLQ